MILETAVRDMFHRAEMHEIKEGRTESQVICCPTQQKDFSVSKLFL